MKVRDLLAWSLILLVWIASGILVSACASKNTASPTNRERPAEGSAGGWESPTPQPTPPLPADAVTAAEAERLYEALDEDAREYQAYLERVSAGEPADPEVLSGLSDAIGRIRKGAAACSRTKDCDVDRFVRTMSELLHEQNLTLESQAARVDTMAAAASEREVDEEEVLEEPGASPFVSAMPELGETVSLFRGTDLREIIHLNGPVKAALDDWLTWNRPMLMRSYEYYQYLRNEIAPIYEEAGLPEALLFAMIATETGGRVHSYSWAGAAGLLQFMPRTGKRYGLSTVDGFDMRLDPVAATKANVAYLNDQLEDLNDSLEKAMAAYNGGEHRMKRLHRTYKGASVWDRRIYYRLPRETREYIPRVLAAAWLFLHPERYNLEWPTLDNETTQLTVQTDISLGELTICLGQVKARNGWFRTLRNLNPRIAPGERVKAGESIAFPAVLVPTYYEQCLEGDLIERAAELHDANYPFGEMDVYIVRRGDTLGRIASRYRCVSTRELASLNNVRPPRYLIRVGQRLRIPNCP